MPETSDPVHRSPVLERHYSVAEIAEQWGVSNNTVRRRFRDEPGVLDLGAPSRLVGGPKKKYKRRQALLRIPESVLVRVRNRLLDKRGPDSVHFPTPGLGRRELHAS